jgi:hypothetical protein
MHMQTNLLDNISNVRPSESQVPKGTGTASVSSLISNRRPNISGEFCTSINWSGAGFTITHSMTGEDIQDVLSLREEDGILVALDSHAKEEMQGPKVLLSKFLL